MNNDPGRPDPLTPVVFHILLVLSRGPLHGYGIMKGLEEDSGMSAGPGTVYGALDRLLEAGWVAEDGPAPRDARRGRAFRITEAGVEAFRGEARRLTRLARLEEVRQVLAEGDTR